MGCGGAPEVEAPLASSAVQSAINDFVAAYNARDLDGMKRLSHPDIEWIAVEGSGVTVLAEGRAALVTEMEGFFASSADTTSSLSNWSVNGDYVAVTETARWTGKDGEGQSQSSIAVYQVEAGLVRRVWYYPAQ